MDSGPGSLLPPTLARCDSPRWRGRVGLALSVLAILMMVLSAQSALADADPDTASSASVTPAQPAVDSSTVGASTDTADRLSRRRTLRTPRLMSSDGWAPGIAGVALALAVVGGLATIARRFTPRPPSGTVQVVGRVSLSPKHSVYMLRVGQRVLLLGAGPQGPPSLITELEDIPASCSPATPQEDRA